MSIPHIKPKFYEINAPLSGKKIKYRPYVSGEELVLLDAQATNDFMTIANSIKTIVEEVTDGKLNGDKDSFVDIVYTFMLARARAEGNPKADVKISCDSCGTPYDATVDVTDVKTEMKNVASNVVELGETDNGTLYIDLKAPSYSSIVNSQAAAMNNHSRRETEAELLKENVAKLFDDESTYDTSTMSDQEWTDFCMTIPSPAYRKIEEFFKNQPTVYTIARGECPKCGMKEQRVEGLKSFSS